MTSRSAWNASFSECIRIRSRSFDSSRRMLRVQASSWTGATGRFRALPVDLPLLDLPPPPEPNDDPTLPEQDVDVLLLWPLRPLFVPPLEPPLPAALDVASSEEQLVAGMGDSSSEFGPEVRLHVRIRPNDGVEVIELAELVVVDVDVVVAWGVGEFIVSVSPHWSTLLLLTSPSCSPLRNLAGPCDFRLRINLKLRFRHQAKQKKRKKKKEKEKKRMNERTRRQLAFKSKQMK